MCQCCNVVTLNRFISERWCHEWWHIKTSNQTLICCLPSSKCPRPTLVVANARQEQFLFRLTPFTTKWKERPCCITLLHRLCCNTLKPTMCCLTRMHANTRLQLRPEVRAACARALWNPFPSVCFCLLITWHHKPSKTERDNQRLVQILVVGTQNAPQLDEVDVMLLNATYITKHAWIKKEGAAEMHCLSEESINICHYMHHTELTF